jgi:hypothetical protein
MILEKGSHLYQRNCWCLLIITLREPVEVSGCGKIVTKTSCLKESDILRKYSDQIKKKKNDRTEECGVVKSINETYLLDEYEDSVSG